LDRSGNLFVTEAANGTVRKITPTGRVSTIARGFLWPWGITVDDKGNIFLVELGSHVVSKIAPSGLVTTLAGVHGRTGSADGVGREASFHQPTAGHLGLGPGNLLVSDSRNAAIRKITRQVP
jgi:hypothetical protein